MIAFLTLCYVALLLLLVKMGVIRLTLGWKLSPVLWFLFLTVALVIPMQWGAPTGNVTMYQFVVQVTPNVAGTVTEVAFLVRISVGESTPVTLILGVQSKANPGRLSGTGWTSTV